MAGITKIVIFGAKGRMGQALSACASRDPSFQIVGRIDLGDNLDSVIGLCDAVIDFSSHNATAGVAKFCASHAKALVIGTTGHSEAERKEVTGYSAAIPIVWSANYSTGVNVLLWLTKRAVETLGPDFDVEIVEMHHRLKKDSPSGTAMSLARAAADARGLDLDAAARYGRQGITGERSKNEIGILALRGGDVVGEHTVICAGDGERIELTHKASNREIFARGALRAARWVVGQPAGLYTMQHVLGLEKPA